jgi:hypothetical protein
VLALFQTIAARIRGFLRPGDLESDFDQEMAAGRASFGVTENGGWL